MVRALPHLLAHVLFIDRAVIGSFLELACGEQEAMANRPLRIPHIEV